MLHIFERWLVFPAPRKKQGDWNPTNLDFTDVSFTADDGTQLHGWFVEHPQPRATILYCHGNGEHVANLTNRLRVLHDIIGVSVFAWDYRGYGHSKGQPHENNVINDARNAQLWLAEQTQTAPADIVLFGRSLGGAVTVALAAEYPTHGLILDRTFSTLADAATYNFPWLPVRLIMRNRFASIEHIQNYHGPLFQMHGTADNIVPLCQGEQLFDAAPSKAKQFLKIADWDHNSPLPIECHQALIEFLDGIQ